ADPTLRTTRHGRDPVESSWVGSFRGHEVLRPPIVQRRCRFRYQTCKNDSDDCRSGPLSFTVLRYFHALAVSLTMAESPTRRTRPPAPSMRLSFFSLFALACAASSVHADPPYVATTPHRSPAEERASFRLPPGFEAQLVAAEPDIQKPINIAFDAKGRL